MPEMRTDRLDASWVEMLDRVQAFVAARVGDPELAADITQDVVVRSIASGALDRVDNPAAWLYRSARNAVIDHYRTRHVHETFDGDDAWPDPGPVDNEPNVATRELARCLHPMLLQLPPAARDALTRVDVDGQSHRQAAAQLGLSVSGMKSRCSGPAGSSKACCSGVAPLASTGPELSPATARPGRRRVAAPAQRSRAAPELAHPCSSRPSRSIIASARRPACRPRPVSDRSARGSPAR